VRMALFIGCSVVCLVAGQIFIKLGLDRIGGFTLTGAGLADKIARVASSPLVWVGMGVTGLSTLFWFDVLSTRDPSYAYPFLSLAYVVMQIASRVLFNEPIPSIRWLGIAFICMGAFFMSRT